MQNICKLGKVVEKLILGELMSNTQYLEKLSVFLVKKRQGLSQYIIFQDYLSAHQMII